jgi:selenocysteine lyase/cysteine desulfurase
VTEAPGGPDWEDLRSRFPALGQQAYLNTAGGGPLCEDAWLATKDYWDGNYQHGDTEWNKWVARVEEVRGKLARMLGAEASEIAFLANASQGLNLAAEIFSGDGTVLGVADDFPSVTLPWLVRGRSVRFLESRADGVVPLDEVSRALEREDGGHVTAVAVSHVQYRTGFRFNLDRLARLCVEGRVPLIVDATQSFGVYPFDLGSTPVSALVFSGYKWATAGYGVAPMFVRKDILPSRGLPAAGWRSGRTPEALDNRTLDLTTDARGLELGHPPFAGVLSLGGALDTIARIGLAAIESRVAALVDELHRGLGARNVPILSPLDREHRSGIVMVGIVEPERVARELRDRRVFVSARGGALRVSLHYYNNGADIDRFFDAFDDLVSRP